MKTTRILTILFLALGLTVCLPKFSEAAPMGTAWTYQGRLLDANSVADGLYDFEFRLFDDPNIMDGNQVGSDVNVADVDVIEGYFTVELDFGSGMFDGNRRWLEIYVRPGESNDTNDFVWLYPRQEVAPTPYAIYAKSGAWDNDWKVDGNDMYSVPSGKVGIGTEHPQKLLHILNREGGYDGLGICLDPHGGGYTGGTVWDIDNHNGKFGLTESRALPGYPKTRFMISDGKVGIGTISPVKRLELAADDYTDLGVRLSTTMPGGTTWDIDNRNGKFELTESRALPGYPRTRFTISDGKVGIGSTSPGKVLELAKEGYTDLGVRLSPQIPGGTTWDIDNHNGKFELTEACALPGYPKTRFTISGGKVGIGIEQPQKLLHILNGDGGYDGLGICLDPHGGGYTGGTVWDIDNHNGKFELTEARALPGYPKTRFTISDGKVGIGTISPVKRLELAADDYTDLGVRLSTTMPGGTTWDIDNRDGKFELTESSAFPAYIIPRLTISNGNVGIGVVNPSKKLEVDGNVKISGVAVYPLDVSIGGPGYVRLQNTATNSPFGVRLENPTRAWQLMQNADGSSDELSIYDCSAAAHRIVIDGPTGNVGMGANPGSYKLFVNGTAYATGGWMGSDLRFKQNIEQIESPIDKISKIRGVTFEWKTSEHKDKGFPEGRHFGVIAQEVEEVLPEIVREGPEGDKAVSYTELVPVLTEAIKQQQQQLEEQQKQIESLRERIKVLENKESANRFAMAKVVQ